MIDPLFAGLMKCFKGSRQYLTAIHSFKKPRGLYRIFFETCTVIRGPRQCDGCNCGIFALVMGWTFAQNGFLEQYVRNRPKCNMNTLPEKEIINVRSYAFICSRAAALHV